MQDRMPKEGSTSITVPREFADRVASYVNEGSGAVNSVPQAISQAWSDYEFRNLETRGPKPVRIGNKMIGHDNIEIVKLKGITEGAACTLLTAKEYIDNKVPLLSFNSDQMIDYDPNETYSRLSLHDGGMPCFKGEGPKWSYAKTDEDGYVTEVAEKKQISNDATAGYYYWSRGSDFVKFAEQMIEADDRLNNEFYVAPVYNYAVKAGKRIVITQVDKVYQMGTPEDLEEYLNGRK